MSLTKAELQDRLQQIVANEFPAPSTSFNVEVVQQAVSLNDTVLAFITKTSIPPNMYTLNPLTGGDAFYPIPEGAEAWNWLLLSVDHVPVRTVEHALLILELLLELQTPKAFAPKPKINDRIQSLILQNGQNKS